ncbi:MAG: OB-fold domain-containing protein [Pseudomonadota bacterium]
MPQKPIQEGLFSWSADDPVLLGSQCTCCEAITFPAASTCMKCSSDAMQLIELGGEGVLWSWTVQRFPPKAPYRGETDMERFKPYGVGYIQLPSGVKVESRLRETEASELSIGMPMRLVVERFCSDTEGNDLMGFLFESAQERVQ